MKTPMGGVLWDTGNTEEEWRLGLRQKVPAPSLPVAHSTGGRSTAWGHLALRRAASSPATLSPGWLTLSG